MTASNYSKWLRLIIYILIVATTVYLPRNLGWTQPLEMFFYDRLIRLRPLEPMDERIVIVGLTEKDIENLAQLPVSDRTLAQLIDNIKKHNPRVIGMDLHRNVPTGSGYYRLKSIIQSTPNLVGVEKTNQGDFDFPAIPPNPEIQQNRMSSASDLIVDSGDVVRRGYLYVSKSSLSSEQLPSFGLKVALEYLDKQSIYPTSSDGEEHYLKLGNAVFPRLRSNREFYTSEDIDNYQVIINFHAAEKPFKIISFSQVLNNNITPDLIEDKIVLIGATASTLGDNFFTPKDRKTIEFQEETFGVEIHAHQTSQIISAALNDRKIIKLLPPTIESFWLLVWIVAPSTLVIKKVRLNLNFSNLWVNYISINLLALAGVILVGYIMLLTGGYWIPLFNPILALATGFALGCSYVETTKEKRTALLLAKKLSEKTEELDKTQKELIAREKLLAYEKLSIKMAHEIRNYLNTINFANDNCQCKLQELELFLESNSFLFEDIYESDSESPKYLADYFENKFGKIKNNINKISLIIESILAENMSSIVQVQQLDVNELIARVIKEPDWMKSQVHETLNLTTELNLASDLPKIKIASIDLERVIVNLLANASDSLYQKTLIDSEYSSKITITTTHKTSIIMIKIKDNGMGISQDHLEKIFTPFWTTKSSVDGVGVGLFFSQQKIEKYNGTLTVESIEGEWTEFTIVLPKTSFS